MDTFSYIETDDELVGINPYKWCINVDDISRFIGIYLLRNT